MPRTPIEGIEEAGEQLKGTPFLVQRRPYVASSPNLFAIYTGDSFGTAVVDTDDSKAVFLIPKVGKLVWIDAEVESVQLSPLKVVVSIAVGFLDNPTPVLKGKIIFECPDGDLSSCGVTFEADSARSTIGPLVDWECLKSCSPGCIKCGTNKWCWLACAAHCVSKCW